MRDVSKILSDAEVLSLKALLHSQTGGAPLPVYEFTEYPRTLYGPLWYPAWIITKEEPDELKRKTAHTLLKTQQAIVLNIEDEEDLLSDGWKSDPNDLVIAATKVDPRIPTGREGRRASADRKREQARELADIRRRYAELTGRRLADAPEEDALLAADAVDLEEPILPAEPVPPPAAPLTRPAVNRGTPAKPATSKAATTKAARVQERAAASARPHA